MIKRIVLWSVVTVSAGFLIGSLALWFVLSSWLPTKGKARLIQELEQRWPMQVSLDAMRYEIFRGIRLDGLQVLDRASGQMRLSAATMRAQVNWVTMLLQQLAQHLHHGTASVVTIQGRLTADHLVWTQGTLRGYGDFLVEGRVVQSTHAEHPGTITATLWLHDGALEGLPSLQTISQIEAKAQLTNERLEIARATATALGTHWTAEGAVSLLMAPSFEMLATARAELAPLIAAMPTIERQWQPSGAVDLSSVCRGVFRPTPLLDCLVHAELRDVTIKGTPLPVPLTNVRGSLDYETLTRRLSISELKAQVSGKELSTHGDVVVSDPPRLSLGLTGTLPLQPLSEWIAAHSSLTDLKGVADLDLQLNGLATELTPTGRVQLREVHANTLSKTIDQLTGPILLTDDDVTIERASLQLDHQPLTVTATLSPSPFGGVLPAGQLRRLIGTVEFPAGQLQMTARLGPEALLVDVAQLSLAQSQVQLSGRLALAADRSSDVRLAGVVELSELKDLPFVSLPWLETWKLQGAGAIELQLQGSLANLQQAVIQGRLRAEHLNVRELPLERVVGTLEQQAGALRIRIPSASFAEGRIGSELTIEYGPKTHDFLLQTDVVGLQLARLSQLLPAWRTHSMTGTASGQVLLSGTWQQRATWRGQGWLDASGERLGDVPLLDKLFQGLFGVLADRVGLDILRRAQITQASVEWQLSQERLSTKQLRLGGMAGTEPIAIYANGSVGLDQTLDFTIEPELSEGTVLQAPGTSTLASAMLKVAGGLERVRRLIGRHRLTGTISHPTYRFEVTTQELFKQLLGSGPGDLLQNLLQQLR